MLMGYRHGNYRNTGLIQWGTLNITKFNNLLLLVNFSFDYLFLMITPLAFPNGMRIALTPRYYSIYLAVTSLHPVYGGQRGKKTDGSHVYRYTGVYSIDSKG